MQGDYLASVKARRSKAPNRQRDRLQTQPAIARRSVSDAPGTRNNDQRVQQQLL